MLVAVSLCLLASKVYAVTEHDDKSPLLEALQHFDDTPIGQQSNSNLDETIGNALQLFFFLFLYLLVSKVNKIIFQSVPFFHSLRARLELQQQQDKNPFEDQLQFVSSTTTTSPLLENTEKSSTVGMDVITLIWYMTTFTALIGFFIVMACTENNCGRRETVKPPENRTCPPTPCPSYKNFGPPSYDSVMKKYKNQRIFIVPVHENNNFFTQPTAVENVATNGTICDLEKGSVR